VHGLLQKCLWLLKCIQYLCITPAIVLVLQPDQYADATSLSEEVTMIVPSCCVAATQVHSISSRKAHTSWLTLTAGANFSANSDPSLAVFQLNYLATLPFDDYNACAVNDDKYDLAVHCTGQLQIPVNLTDGIYTFLWHWVINNTSPTPVDGVTLYLDYRFAFEVNVNTTLMQ